MGLKEIKERYKRFFEKEESENQLNEALALMRVQRAMRSKKTKIIKLEEALYYHGEVLDSFQRSGIKMNELPLIPVKQSKLKEINEITKEGLGYALQNTNYINGMYLPERNVILLDKQHIQKSDLVNVVHTIAHEYAHSLYDRWFSAIEFRKKYGINLNKSHMLPQSTSENNFEKKLKGKSKIKKVNLTLEQKREHEFDHYFEEMFVDSVAQYVLGIPDGDSRFFNYSKICQGEILGEDREFMDKMESVLYKSFYDGMFTKGLKQVVLELPFCYWEAKNVFMERYQLKLEEKLPIRL